MLSWHDERASLQGGSMAKVTGFGGAFLRANDPESLHAWYEQHLGISRRDGCFAFQHGPQQAHIAVAFFPKTSDYFPVSQPAMLNFQVDDLDSVMQRLASVGVSIDPKREEYEYGRFGWFTDPEGNRVELWEPPAQPSSQETIS
jgi:predicted enzyme related to lactoylglutathione lyase